MRIQNFYSIVCSIPLFVACSSTLEPPNNFNQLPTTLTPTPPGEVGKVVDDTSVNNPLPHDGANTSVAPRSRLTLTSGATPPSMPMVSIMNNSSGIITVWALAVNNWLWGYSPFDTKSFGQIRNWYVLKNANGSVSFRNVQTGTCMSAYGNGIIHSYCDRNNLNQQFDLLPLTNGAIAIKNANNQQCLRIPEIRSTVYMPITFARCLIGEQPTIDQQWFIIPPILDAYPIPN